MISVARNLPVRLAGLLAIPVAFVGASLRALVTDRGALPGPQAVAVVLDLLAGFGAVHDLGLVHRNVRPESVWLDGSGRARLAAFELACPGVEHAIAAAGEPPYASPEQQRGEALDARSDLWSCGAVLAELLTGQVPGPTAQPSEMDGVPARLWPVVAGALAPAPAPADRPDSAAQLADRLRAAAKETMQYTGFNGPGFDSRTCGPVLVHPDLDGRYRQLVQETRLPVKAVVPVRRPWQGEPDVELPVVRIDDDIHRGEEVMVPERSVPC